jgi:hypothetical protein
MPAHSRPKDGVAWLAYGAGIHAFNAASLKIGTSLAKTPEKQ